MKILGIIPARGGSKGVPRKNIKLLGGKPLIQYTIDLALQTKQIDTLMVSTDDSEIAGICKDLGADIPALRPAELASDSSPTIDTVHYVLKQYLEKGIKFDAVCLLQATSPFRKLIDLEGAISKFIQQDLDSLVSVLPVPTDYNPHWVFFSNDKDLLQISTGAPEIITRRQALPSAFHRDGMIYLVKSSVVLEKTSLYGAKIGYYLSSSDVHVNIDTMDDWNTAERLIANLDKSV